MADIYSGRAIVIRGIYMVILAVFVLRLAILQIIDSGWKEAAQDQSLRYNIQYPARGLIYDRNGKLLVSHDAVYDLMVIPSMTKGNDTAYMCKKLGISHQEYEDRMQRAMQYSRVAASIFMKQISKDEYASWQSDMRKFKGFYIVQRTLRYYERPVGAHVLGYVGEVDENDIAADNTYSKGDYIGKSGLEKSYESVLRGRKGRIIMQVDVHSREIGHYKGGAEDVIPIVGSNLYTTLDVELQEYAEQLMANKRGCVVAIEPSTGEVLTLVSAPSYNPNLLVGRSRSENYEILNHNIAKPLYNRALQAQYPPGSIFKVAQAMTALDLGVITPETGFACDKVLGCHNHPSARTVQEAIKMSCNPYFYYTYKRIIQQGKYNDIYKDSQYGLTVWREYMLRFGFGQRLEIDLPNVNKGRIPDTAFYNKCYRGPHWAFSTIYSNSIGQGEVEVVPLQMANLACIVANRGYYYTPHLVRYIGDDSTEIPEYKVRHNTGIANRYFDIAVAGMYDVVHGGGGTGHRANVPGLDVCGKTGTAENKGNDHSVFIAFAPRNNPKIALAVYVENAAGGGGSWAAPIAGLIIEKYVNREVKRVDVERQYKEANPCQSLPLVGKVKPKGKKH